MGRGLGPAQRGILDALHAAYRDPGHLWLTVPDLAEAIGRDQRQVRAAVRALEARGRVVITTGHTGWSGPGVYGRERIRGGAWGQRDDRDRDLPTFRVIREGDEDKLLPWDHVACHDIEVIRQGMPRHGLQVWLPEPGMVCPPAHATTPPNW